MGQFLRNMLDLEDLIATSNFKKSGDLKDLAVISTNAVLRRRMEADDAVLAAMAAQNSRYYNASDTVLQPGDTLKAYAFLGGLIVLTLASILAGAWLLVEVVVPIMSHFS